ncbi:HAD family hydrolase [Streptomyces genisteinicus]|uniref:HAD family hydrolase n=1 Tax=Streptomyces genisteinicus TaxID=2768068 RepID=UPI001FEBDB89|nr:HAD family hydrolase [Streptomyces genisteinicus]
MPHATATPAQPFAIREAVIRAQCVVLDLDGPVARLFAREPAHEVARQMLCLARDDGRLADGVRDPADPIAVLHAHTDRMRRLGHDPGWRTTVEALHDLLDSYERKAAESAEPTPYAADFIRACHASGRTLAIATNNHADAAVRIIERMGVRDCFDGPVVGRTGDATLMKPHPRALLAAMSRGVPAGRHLMIGDTVSDFRAARQIEMPFCGYHRHVRGRQRLLDAGVPYAASEMGEFLEFVADTDR